MYRVFSRVSADGEIKFSTTEYTIIRETKCFYVITLNEHSDSFRVSIDDYESQSLYIAESAEKAIEICARKMLKTSIRIIDAETTKINRLQKYLKENYNE